MDRSGTRGLEAGADVMTRVLAHAHTTWSHDGCLPLGAYIHLARRAGCSVVLLSEHEESGWTQERYESYKRACAEASTRDVHLVPGLEFLQNGRHVLCYGLQWLPQRPCSVDALADAAHAQGCVLTLAHPAKYQWRIPYTVLIAVDVVEVWNSKWIYDGAIGPHPRSLRVASGKRVMVGQDIHKAKHLSRLVVITKSDYVLEDLASGRYGFACGGRAWSHDELRTPGRTLPPRVRRVWMDALLSGHRAAGRILDGPPSQARRPAPSALPTDPLVSVVLPIRNEAAYISRSLASVLAQDYPAHRMEVLVADGRSDDGTRETVRGFASRFGDRLKLIDNPGRIVSTGLNAARPLAAGDVIVRVDGHCEIPPDYVRRAVEHLLVDGVDCVGGLLETIGETPTAHVIAIAMSSPFGLGGSAFRSGAPVSTLTDSVAFPAWTRQAMQRTGPFDEELVRNQDDEYSYRLRRLGGRILLATDIRTRYYSRSTFRSLFRQCFEYGIWKVRVLQKHPRQMRPRQFVPGAFVAAVLLSILSSFVSFAFLPLAVLIVAAYALAAGIAAWRASRTHGWSVMLSLPLAFGAMHVAYGTGFLIGVLRFWRHWRRFGRGPIVVGPGRPGEAV
jgi:glycosyltransferase involved in cell wall biosynthesis